MVILLLSLCGQQEVPDGMGAEKQYYHICASGKSFQGPPWTISWRRAKTEEGESEREDVIGEIQERDDGGSLHIVGGGVTVNRLRD